MTHRIMLLVGFIVTAGIASYSLISKGGVLTTFPTSPSCEVSEANCSRAGREDSFIQVVLQPNTPETAAMSEDILFTMAKKVRSHHHIEISILSGTQDVYVFHSGRANRRTFQNLYKEIDSNSSTPEMTPTSSKEEALVSGMQRLRDRIKYSSGTQEIHFYLMTKGTSNPSIIKQIQTINSELEDYDLSQTHVYVIGLNEEHRIPFSEAFNPIKGIVKFASQNSHEWEPLVKSF